MPRDSEGDEVWRSPYSEGVSGPGDYGTPPPAVQGAAEKRRAHILGASIVLGGLVMISAVAMFMYSLVNEEGVNIGAPIVFAFGAVLVGVSSSLRSQ